MNHKLVTNINKKEDICESQNQIKNIYNHVKKLQNKIEKTINLN
jgi:hypothetical protein